MTQLAAQESQNKCKNHNPEATCKTTYAHLIDGPKCAFLCIKFVQIKKYRECDVCKKIY